MVPALENSRLRYQLYGVIAAAFFVLAVGLASLKSRFDFLVSDAAYYYVYLPSLLLDGDLDFANQAQYTPNLAGVSAKFPIGLAVTLVPSFLVGHGASLIMHACTGWPCFEPNGFTVVYQIAHLLFVMGLGVASFVLLDRLLTQYFRLSGRATALGISVFWVGSHYAYYYFREPLFIHVTSAFWVVTNVALVEYLVTGMPIRGVPAPALFLYVFTGAMAVVCRPTNAFLLTFAVYFLAATARERQLRRLLAAAPAVLLGLSPILGQLLVWHCTVGRWVHYSYRESFTYWHSPRMWQTLLASRHGLFFWSPVLVGSAIGIAWHGWQNRARRDPLIACWLASFALLWYANSAWEGWWFGDAFGARAFLELSGLFVLGLAFFFENLPRVRARYQWGAAALMAAAILYNYILMGLYITHHISRSRPLLG